MALPGRIVLVAVLTTGLLVGGLLAAGPPGGVATAGHVESLGFSQVSALVHADGGWWVVERSLRGGGGVVYRYTDDWEPTGEHHRLSLDRERRFSPVDIAPARDGGWWVLGIDGRVYRFTDDWNATGEHHVVPSPYGRGNVTEGFGLTRARGGGWWVAAERGLFRATPAWTPANGSVGGVRSRDDGYPVATTYGPGDDRLLVLDGYTGRGVVRLPLTDGGGRVAPTAVPDKSSPVGVAVPDQQYPVASVVGVPVDVVRTGDRWWVVDGDGQVHRFDRYWRYTGVTHEVGSGDAVGTYPSDFVTPAFLLVPLLRGLAFVPGLVLVAGTLVQDHRTPHPSVLVGGLTGFGFVYGVVTWPYAVRPAVFAAVHLPLVATVAALVGPPAHIYWLAEAGYEARSLLPLAVGYVMVVGAALVMVGPAVRVLGG